MVAYPDCHTEVARRKAQNISTYGRSDEPAVREILSGFLVRVFMENRRLKFSTCNIFFLNAERTRWKLSLVMCRFVIYKYCMNFLIFQDGTHNKVEIEKPYIITVNEVAFVKCAALIATLTHRKN